MAEGTYEYECMRAELLGIDKPDYEEFLKNKKEKEEAQTEEVDIENIKETELENEGFGRIGGKFDELNNILKNTHKKINRFRASCGSLTHMLKIRIGSSNAGSSESLASTSGIDNPENTIEVADEDNSKGSVENTHENDIFKNNEGVEETPVRKSDLSKALDKNVGYLDSLIDKAEQAELSMRYQRKQIDKFVK